jgi:hypothetical protein
VVPDVEKEEVEAATAAAASSDPVARGSLLAEPIYNLGN